MSRSVLSLADARDLPHVDLVERCGELLADYDRPQVESATEKMTRINRILDEMPATYRWFRQLESFCDHWTSSFEQMFGRTDKRYKEMRQRRDLFESMASAAKLQYEGASRQVTIMESFTTEGMPRTRHGE